MYIYRTGKKYRYNEINSEQFLSFELLERRNCPLFSLTF